MGCPDVYYKMMLAEGQRLCECFMDTKLNEPPEWFRGKNANILKCDKTIEALVEGLLKTRDLFNNKDLFYFLCGGAMKTVLAKAEEDGCDAMNASAASMSSFMDLLGFEDDGE